MQPEIHPMPEPIAKAIGAIMTKVKNVEKQGTNTFHNYKFAKVEDLLFQVQPAMAEAGLVITQDEIHHEVLSDAIMLATYAFSLSHDSGVTWGPIRQTGMSNLRNTKGGYDDKALNKCHTAARKYFILGLFQVPAGDLPDVDSEEDKPAPERKPEAKRTEPQTPTLADRADRLEATLRGVKTVTELDKAFKLASGLCAELADKDAPRLTKIEALRSEREEAFASEMERAA